MSEVNLDLASLQSKLLSAWLKQHKSELEWYPKDIEAFYDIDIMKQRVILWEFLLTYGSELQRESIRKQLLSVSEYLYPSHLIGKTEFG